MSEFPPTPEQTAIIDFLRASSSRNLQINALAGAAKTSTLVLIAEAIRKPMLAIAFNKAIATELQLRMPSTVVCKTMNALGHKALGGMLGKRLTMDMDKKGRILKSIVDSYGPRDKEVLYEGFKDLIDAFNKGYGGWIPDRLDISGGRAISDDSDFFASLPFEPSRVEQEVLEKCMIQAITEAFKGTICFDDQILIPACFPCRFDSFPVVMVDEAQDLSPINHVLLGKIAKHSQLIAVGDPCQAIYGFRGADASSMPTLQRLFQMDSLPLTMSFRCPVAVADHVRWRAPYIQSPEWAKPGLIRKLGEWSEADIPDSAAIICRNNAPLMSCAMRLIRAGRKPEIRGNDITKGLVKTMKSLGKPHLPREEFQPVWEKESEKLRRRYKNSDFIADKISCINFFLGEEETLGAAIARAEQIMNASGPIQLMTGHKSKGLEFTDVYFLDEHLINPERGGEQEDNLRYVICTRSKENLTYITSDGWRE